MSGAPPLSQRLREATAAAHRAAERSRLIAALLAGRLARVDYCRLLRNLHALYAALESGLAANAKQPGLAPWCRPELWRSPAIAEDLASLRGAGWADIPLAAAMRDYLARLTWVGRERPALLAAHAYVRYLGDLSGGQLLRAAVTRGLQLASGAGVAFYEFGPPGPEALKDDLRAALDAFPAEGAASEEIVAEAVDAFARHRRLFDELAADAAGQESAFPAA